VLDVLAVDVELDSARAFQRVERLDRRRQFHAVVRGQGLAALQFLDRAVVLQHRAPAAGPRIARARPVGVDHHRCRHDAAGREYMWNSPSLPSSFGFGPSGVMPMPRRMLTEAALRTSAMPRKLS